MLSLHTTALLLVACALVAQEPRARPLHRVTNPGP